VRSSAHRAVALLTLAFVLLGTAFALLVPMFTNFDEQAHLDRARSQARDPWTDPGPSLRITHGSWGALAAVRGGPVPMGIDGEAHRARYKAIRDYPGGNAPDEAPCPGLCQNIQYAHPPAWYLLVAPVTAVLEGQTFPRTVLALRLLDVLLVAPTVALGWLTATEVWPRRPRRALAVAAGVAVAGPLAYTASGVNNDALLLLAMATGTWLAARILRRGADLRLALALGVVLSIGLLTKVQMVLTAPVLGAAVLVAPSPWRVRWRSALVAGAAALPGILWWGRELSQEGPLSPESSELLRPAVPGPWTDRSYPGYVLEHVDTLLGRLWGIFADPITFVPGPVRVVLNLGVLVLVVGWLVCRRWQRPTVADLRWAVLAAVPVALVLGVMWASLDAHRRTGEIRGLAPRYLYPATIVLVLGVVGAASTIVARLRLERHRGLLLTAGLGVGAAVGSAAFLARGVQAHYGTTSWSDILHRVEAVGPLGQPAAVVAVGVLWVVAVALAARQLWVAAR
jgi:hypothetical protein